MDETILNSFSLVEISLKLVKLVQTDSSWFNRLKLGQAVSNRFKLGQIFQTVSIKLKVVKIGKNWFKLVHTGINF